MSKLLNDVRNTLRVHHYALITEKTYLQWNKRFILFHNKTHPLQRRIPVVLSQREVNVILATLQGQHQLIDRLS